MNYKALTFVLCACLGQSALADDKVGAYIGAKVGMFSIDNVEGIEVDDSTSFGILGGYHFGGGFAAEVEYNRADSIDLDGPYGLTGDGEADTLALYGVYRMHPAMDTPLYLKIKAGFVNIDSDFDTNVGSFSDSDTKFTAGAGAGFQLSQNLMLEAEYTRISEDVDMWSAGLNFQF